MRQVSQRIRLALRWVSISVPVIRFPLVNSTPRGNRLHGEPDADPAACGSHCAAQPVSGVELVPPYSKRLHKRLMSTPER
jgi:hypothetical protein